MKVLKFKLKCVSGKTGEQIQVRRRSLEKTREMKHRGSGSQCRGSVPQELCRQRKTKETSLLHGGGIRRKERRWEEERRLPVGSPGNANPLGNTLPIQDNICGQCAQRKTSLTGEPGSDWSLEVSKWPRFTCVKLLSYILDLLYLWPCHLFLQSRFLENECNYLQSCVC